MLLAAFCVCACGVPPDPSREQPVQVRSNVGLLYFPYDAGVPLARFALNLDGGNVPVLADDFDDANFDRYTQTMAWVIRRATELARTNNARAAQHEKTSP